MSAAEDADPIGMLIERQEIEQAELDLRHTQEYVDLISTMDWAQDRLGQWQIVLRAKGEKLVHLRQRMERLQAGE